MSPPQRHAALAALKLPEIRYFLGSIAFFTLANRAAIVVIGLQIYQITHSALALGILGLVEAIPAISLSLYGGYVADRWDRRTILLATRSVSVLCGLLLALITFNLHAVHVSALYGVIFLAGIARGFADPAMTAFEAQVVPKHLTVNATSWIGSTWLSCSAIGPALVGFAYEAFGPGRTYLVIAAGFAMSWIFTCRIPAKPYPAIAKDESIFKSIKLGVKFVLKEQALVGSMALDLFAVLFGGAVALLPIFATDILHVGARGLGFLEAAPALGALIVMLWSTHHPPIRRAGRNLLLCVACFGFSIIVFAFSRNFALSLLALFLSGVFDGVSMVIRRSILRLMSPEHMRGRVAAVNWIFIGASNEIGAFESGLVAHWIGVIPCVWAGGVVTLLVVAVTALAAPRLRNLGFDPKNLDIKNN
ncbi:MAG: MFS transporter [Candidatus Omnitrophota bacterium]|nr:MFS transporter [Candidatus Omnitrophota bacterium]MDZ4242215.1 MFS transporter [Candidatus Omnitrophota bacterium]